MTMESAGVIFAIIMGFINLAYLVTKDKGQDVWKLSDRLTKLDQSRVEFRESLFHHVEERYDAAVNAFGETMRAHAEHLRLLELTLYKNFVQQETFKDSISAISSTMNERLNRLDKRFDTIEEMLRKPSFQARGD